MVKAVSNPLQDELVATLSHDLRTPLTSILIATQLMEREGSLDDQSKKHVELIRRSAKLIQKMIQDVSDAADARKADEMLTQEHK